MMTMNKAQILNKARGALIGSALGDAIGLYTGQFESSIFQLSAFRFVVEFPRLIIRRVHVGKTDMASLSLGRVLPSRACH